MKNLKSILDQKLNLISQITASRVFAPVILGLVAIVSYALFIPWLGYYGDDWSYIWLLFKANDISPFFAANREVLASFYAFIARFLGPIPWHWQVLTLIARWLISLMVFFFIHQVWPQNKSRALWIALVFLVFPGFFLQFNSVTFVVGFLVLASFFLSFYLTIHAVKHPIRSKLYHILAILLSAINLISIEYFYMIELLRVIFIWIALPEGRNKRDKLKKVLVTFIPYFSLFFAVSIWRILDQSQITHQYGFTILDKLKSNPGNTLLSLAQQILRDFWQSTLGVWWQAIFRPEREILNPTLTAIHWILVAGSIILLVIFLSRLTTQPRETRFKANHLLWIGLIALFLGGIPVWVPGLQPDKDYSTTRLYLPYLTGAAFLFVGLIESIPTRHLYKTILFSAAIGLAIGTQFTFANFFRQDWVLQRNFYWQLAWRMPGLKPGSTILADRLPSRNGEENAQSAAINYIFTENPEPGHVDYYVYFIPERIDFIPELLETGRQLNIPHLIGTFTGSSDQVIGIHLDERNCIRLINPVLDSKKSELPPYFGRLPKDLIHRIYHLTMQMPH